MQIPVTGWIGGLLLGVGSGAATAPPADSVEAVQNDLEKAYEDGLLSEEAKELIDRCFDLAAERPEAEEKVGALSLVLMMTTRVGTTEMTEIFREAAGTLVEKFVNSPALARTVLQLPVGEYDPEGFRTAARETLDEIAEATEAPEVQAACVIARLSPRVDQWEYEGMSPEETAALIEEVRDFQSTFGDLQHPFKDQSYETMCAGILFKLENLSIGAIAPDIEGEDVDGVKFKLSDYSGKVVMLDFWGDW